MKHIAIFFILIQGLAFCSNVSMESWSISSENYSLVWSCNSANPKKDYFVGFYKKQMDSALFKFICYGLEITDELSSSVERDVKCSSTFTTSRFMEEIKNFENYSGIQCLDHQNGIEYLKSKIEISKTIIFWTGAGISVYAGVPSLLELYESLSLTAIPYSHLVSDESLHALIKKLQENKQQAEEIIGKLFDFLRKIKDPTLELQPTQAHIALASLSKELRKQEKKIYHYTSNLDCLGQRVGLVDDIDVEQKLYIYERVICDDQAEQNNRTFVEPDLLIIFGLRCDDKGLAEVVSKNKRGEIISVNINKPEMFTYLYDETGELKCDSYPYTWIRADLQSFLPDLKECFEKIQSTSKNECVNYCK